MIRKNNSRAEASPRRNAHNISERKRCIDQIRFRARQEASRAALTRTKLKSQTVGAELALAFALQSVFAERRPLDRAMSVFLRENRRYGSRDRQFISECVFAVFRHWGVLTAPLAAEAVEALKQGSFTGVTPGYLFVGGLYLDGAERPEAAAVWLEDFNVTLPPPAADYFRRVHALMAAFYPESGVQISASNLVPEWAVGRLPEGLSLEELGESLRRRPPMWLRVQNGDVDGVVKALEASGLTVRRAASIPDAVAVIGGRVNLFTLDAFRAGAFEVQDLASQTIGLVAAPKHGERWFDCCAGAGGKTLQLATLMHRKGTVQASDIRAYKLEDLRKRARRAGFPNIICKEWDGKPLRKKHQGAFDGVLVDAPCSCSGVWRRNPDGRWVLTEAEIAEMSALQKTILANASTAVHTGGVLIYATCSLFEAENGEVVRDFLATHDEFVLEPFADPMTGVQTDGMLSIVPGKNEDCDGMFVARMRKKF